MTKLNINKPRSGSLLLSEPFMLDPNFQRSVIVLCEHNEEEGVLGYVLNQPTDVTIGDLMEDMHDCDFPVFLGGPVEQNTLHFLYRKEYPLLDGKPLGNGVYMGGNYEELMSLLRQGNVGSDDLKLFMGYCG